LFLSANSSRGVPPTPAEGGALLYIPHHILLYTMSPQPLVYYILNNPSHSTTYNKPSQPTIYNITTF
jgi:hypothetical protein